MSEYSVKIVVATHKKYKIPSDAMYIPLYVGAEGKKDSDGNELDLGYIKDNTGENISILNPSFCELTGLYWAWKNLEAENIGLVHYRRYFTNKKKIPKEENEKFKIVLTQKETEELLKKTDIILPKKRKYYIENLYSHYEHTMYIEPLDETRRIIEEKCPEYLGEFDKLHKRTSAHMFNMFIMKKEILDELTAPYQTVKGEQI